MLGNLMGIDNIIKGISLLRNILTFLGNPQVLPHQIQQRLHILCFGGIVYVVFVVGWEIQLFKRQLQGRRNIIRC